MIFLPATSRQSLWLTVIRKMSLLNIHMIFCELVIVWRGNGLHVLNDRPYRITRGDLFYIHADDKHSYASVNDLVLQNIIYCPERLKLNLDWQGGDSGI